MSFPLLLSLLALIVSVVCLAGLILLFKRYNSQLEINANQKQAQIELSKKVNNLREEIHEIRSGNHGVMSRFKELVQQVDNLKPSRTRPSKPLLQ